MVERQNWHRREREKRRDDFERSRRRIEENRVREERRRNRDYIANLEGDLGRLQQSRIDKAEMRSEAGKVLNAKEKITRRKKARVAVAGAAGAGLLYAGSPLPGYIRDGVNNLISTSRAARNFYDALMKLVSGGGTERDIIRFFDENKEYTDTLGDDIQTYRSNLESKRDDLIELKRAYETLGRHATHLPGFESAPVKEVTGLRNRIVGVISGVVRGDREKQEIRRSPEYEKSYTDALKVIEKAEAGKDITNEEMKVLLKKLEETRLGGTIDAELKYIDETIEAVRGLAKTYNEYQSVSNRFEGLSPKQIRDRDESYQEVIKKADQYKDIKGSDYEGNAGDVAAISAGLVLAAAGAYAGTKVRDMFGYRPNTRKIEKMLAKQDRKKAKREGLEGKIGVFLVGVFAIYFLMIANKVTGYSLLSDFSKQQDVGLIALFALIMVYGLFLFFRKVYKK